MIALRTFGLPAVGGPHPAAAVAALHDPQAVATLELRRALLRPRAVQMHAHRPPSLIDEPDDHMHAPVTV
jgi:hypothetical protein